LEFTPLRQEVDRSRIPHSSKVKKSNTNCIAHIKNKISREVLEANHIADKIPQVISEPSVSLTDAEITYLKNSVKPEHERLLSIT